MTRRRILRSLLLTCCVAALWPTPSSVVFGFGLESNTGGGIATGLKTATTTVDVSAATAPTNGQVLTASNSTTAAWVTPTAGAATNITPGTTTIIGATAPCLIRNSATTAMDCLAIASGNSTALGVTTGSAGAPVLFNGAGGTPSSLTLTSATGLPISTGLTGAGTGVITALGVNTGSAGAFTKNNGDALSGTFTGSPTFSGATITFSGATPLLTGLSAGTQVSCLGLDSGNHIVLNAAACGSGGGSISVSGGGNTTTGVTTLAFGNGFIATPNGANTTSTVNTTLVDITKTANYSVAAGDMGNGLTLSTAATLTLPAASSTIFAPGMSLSINALAPWAITNSTGLTASANVPTAVLAGAQGTFVANNDGTHLDYFGTLGALSGTFTMATSAITSGTCATVVTVSAPGVLTTDTVTASFNGDPTGITGFVPSASGVLTEYVYPTANNVNIKECNFTSGSITPAAHTFNWRVAR